MTALRHASPPPASGAARPSAAAGREELFYVITGFGDNPSATAAREELSSVERASRPAVPAMGAKPARVRLDIGGWLTGAEALRLDVLSLRHGVPPEALAAAAVRALLRRRPADAGSRPARA